MSCNTWKNYLSYRFYQLTIERRGDIDTEDKWCEFAKSLLNGTTYTYIIEYSGSWINIASYDKKAKPLGQSRRGINNFMFTIDGCLPLPGTQGLFVRLETSQGDCDTTKHNVFWTEDREVLLRWVARKLIARYGILYDDSETYFETPNHLLTTLTLFEEATESWELYEPKLPLFESLDGDRIEIVILILPVTI